METHDKESSAQLRSGDPDSVVRFIQANQPVLLGFIRKRIGMQLQKKIEPEDILQEASIEAVKNFSKVDLDNREPLNWLFQICERKIIDAHRHFFASQKRSASRDAALGSQAAGGLADLLVASITSPSQAFSRDQKQLRMMAALDMLPETQREALRLRYLIGLPSKEVAQKLGKSDGAVRVILSRGLVRLHEMLVE
jgi:RNA polymerase sigma-70 factor (subfamily 1)